MDIMAWTLGSLAVVSGACIIGALVGLIIHDSKKKPHEQNY